MSYINNNPYDLCMETYFGKDYMVVNAKAIAKEHGTDADNDGRMTQSNEYHLGELVDAVKSEGWSGIDGEDIARTLDNGTVLVCMTNGERTLGHCFGSDVEAMAYLIGIADRAGM